MNLHYSDEINYPEIIIESVDMKKILDPPEGLFESDAAMLADLYKKIKEFKGEA